MIRSKLVALAGTVALLATTACSAPALTPTEAKAEAPYIPFAELEILEDPRSYEGPSTAQLQDETIVPVVEDVEQELPTTVTSYDQHRETQVEITDTSRVITLDVAGSIAATVWSLGFGDTLVGRDQSTTFPGTEELPLVTGGGHSVNIESVIELEPDVVITDGTVGPRDVIEQLRDVGIAVVFVENDASFAGAEELAKQVATVYGAPAAGDTLAAHLAAETGAMIEQIAEVVPEAEDERLRMVFLYLRGGAGVYYMFGEGSGADELINALGGIDVAGEYGWEGMKPMTDEALIDVDPDLILTMSGGIASVHGIEGLLEEKPAIGLTHAGEHHRIVDMDDGAVLSFGPRAAHVLEALARAVYAPDSLKGGEGTEE